MSYYNDDRYSEYSREELVTEYIEAKVASIVVHIPDWHAFPKDVPKDPAYWKARDQNFHEMHLEIARRYHIPREKCLWLENVADSTELYCHDYKLKSIIKDAIKSLEELEEKEMH